MFDELSVLFVVTPDVFDLSQESFQLVWIKMVGALFIQVLDCGEFRKLTNGESLQPTRL